MMPEDAPARERFKGKPTAFGVVPAARCATTPGRLARDRASVPRPLVCRRLSPSSKPYNGINVVCLWADVEMRGLTTPIWATYRQWSELGCQVNKGAKGEMVLLYKECSAEPDPDNADDDGKRRVARASDVFNAADVDGFTPPNAPERLGPIARIEAVDRFITATGAKIEHGGERAFYRPSTDTITMPDEGLFCGTDAMTRDESYFAVLLHEATHWTAPKGRCDSDLSRFGKSVVAAEELVALSGLSEATRGEL